MPRQLAFNLPNGVALGRGDFYVSDANRAALEAVENWRDWPGGKLVLTGPEGAGKTHLAHVFADLTGAEIIAPDALTQADPAALAGRNLVLEDLDRAAGDGAAEAAAFHLHNLILAEGGRLLITGRDAPGRWGLTLPDLASRVAGATMHRLAMPDEALMMALLMKLFADRQIAASPSLIAYLAPRIERSFQAAQEVVATLDAQALAEGVPLGRTLARRVLEARDAPGLDLT
ncbi:MAG: chromosomal replication initiator DnaA [Rhodobacterales bacterium]|nr:MAG: chromosomal replication initiator DnaA [Rhodobacterales bacterium]